MPLSDLLKRGKSEQVQCIEAKERAYSLLKSGVEVAAVLLQENEEKLYRVGYASKRLSLAETKYPIIEKECLAVLWFIRCCKLWQEINTPDRS